MKKSLKVIVPVVLALALIVAMCVLPACKDKNSVDENKPEFSMAIISDLHVMDVSQIDETASSPAYLDKMSRSQKMLTISSGVLATEADALVADSSISAVLVCGDMTEDGSKVAHEYVAAQLKKIEASGKKVFVTPGNHDINKSASAYSFEGSVSIDNVSPEEFATIYADFGYSEAIARDAKTLSYVADLDGSRRIISIDACHYDNSNPDYGRDHDNLTDDLLNWIKAQLTACQNDGKKAVAMVHFPVTSHVGAIAEDFDMSVKILRSEELCNALIAGGVEYIFTGHLHTNDINTYTSADGKTLYDVETGSLTNYSMPVRFYTEYAKRTEIKTVEMDHIDEKYIPACVSAEEKALMLANFTSYAENYVADSMFKKIVSKLDGVDITPLLGMLGLNEDAAEVVQISTDFYNDVFHKFAYMKMYEKDAEAGEPTVEGICKNAGVTIPASKYSGTVVQFVMGLFCRNYEGDENITLDSAEYQLLEYSVYSALYLLADFDFFGRINAIDASMPDVAEEDFKYIISGLIKTGKLNVTDPDIISSLLGSFDYDGDNFIITMITGVSNAQALLELLTNSVIKGAVSGLTELIPEPLVELITKVLDGAIDAQNGTIDLQYILREVVLARYAPGVLVDNGVPDKNITVDKETGALVA